MRRAVDIEGSLDVDLPAVGRSSGRRFQILGRGSRLEIRTDSFRDLLHTRRALQGTALDPGGLGTGGARDLASAGIATSLLVRGRPVVTLAPAEGETTPRRSFHPWAALLALLHLRSA